MPVKSAGEHELGDEHRSSPTWLFDGTPGTPTFTHRSKLAPLIVAAAVALAAVACDGLGEGSRTRTKEILDRTSRRCATCSRSRPTTASTGE